VNCTEDDLKRKQCLLDELTDHVQQSSLIDHCVCSYYLTSFFVVYFEMVEGDIV
jgi:hypothetical protein